MSSLVSRATAGLRTPRSVSHDVHPDSGGIAIHWAGERQDLGGHPQCIARWRQWQTMHMDVKGWNDIAYNWGVCDHGFILVGRGWGVRSAANGSDDGNERYLAICWLGGQGESPSALALAGFETLIADCRRRGAAMDVRPHQHFFATACPGPVLTQMAARWAAHPLGGAKKPSDPPARPSAGVKAPTFPLADGWAYGPEAHRIGVTGHGAGLTIWQRKVGVTADGDYGPVTRQAALRLQTRWGLTQDGLIGARTWAAAWRTK